MAKTTAPLLSFEGGGQLGKTLVYANWKGRNYARRYVIPANPNSSGQQLTRNTFGWLNNVWKFMPGSATGAWDAYADSQRFTARNGFMKQNVGALRTQTDLNLMVISPSAKSGLIAASITTTPGANQIQVDLTEPSLPTGWTIVSAFAACIRDQDPQTEEYYEVTAGSDASSPYSITLTGLTSSVLYQVGGWFQFDRGDGTYAYGQSLQTTDTPT